MRLLDNIPRIKSPGLAAFQRRFMLEQRPVILTDFMDARPIRRVTTPRMASAALGHVPLALQADYQRGSFAPLLGRQPKRLLKELLEEPPVRRPFPKYCSLDQYLDLLRRVPETTALCLEQPSPAEMQEFAPIPDYCRQNDPSGADTIDSHLFVANRGALARLHFDLDHRHNLLYQVFGVKRVTLFPPTMSRLLNPHGNSSLLTLQNIPDAERLRLLKFAGGYDSVLQPGETLYIPTLWWHCLEYRTVAMSVNFRFGRNPYNYFLAEKLHPSIFAQGVGTKFVNLHRRPDRRYQNAFRRLREEYNRPAGSPLMKYDRIHRLMADLYAELCPEAIQGTWWLPLEKYFTWKDKRNISRFYYGARKP